MTAESNCLDISRLDSLPDDVLRQMHEEYFFAKDTCDRYLISLSNDNSKRLQHKPLLEPTEKILKNPYAVEYLRSKHIVFDQMYREHYIENKKGFVRLNMLESFVLSLLIWLHH